MVALLLAAPVLAFAVPVQAAAEIQRWSLADTNGDGWAISLFEQPDPDFPKGWRLRLTALALGEQLDHQRGLELEDSQGSHWQLANHSEEQVPAGDPAVPASSAQFDLARLQPRPSAILPLRLAIPLQNGTDQALMLSPEIVEAIGLKAGQGS
ncbi:hypothetical protein BM449_01210 [Synechococcus sp. SynAce01]|nr:hypothetical protein BM449_01210 [Synechococcus sp. SynAce01]